MVSRSVLASKKHLWWSGKCSAKQQVGLNY